MTTSNTHWQLFSSNSEICEKLSTHLNRHPLICQILLNRGIRSLEDAQLFLNPKKNSEANFDRKLLNHASELILDHIAKKNHILIYSDYDADGITSTAILAENLRKLGGNVSYIVPHRFEDGYGLNEGVIDKIVESKPHLLITLDCGVSNAKEIKNIKSRVSVDIIIMDHHKLPDKLPDANVIINPQTLDESHSLRNLCTAGIVYKFLEYMDDQFNMNLGLESCLDLVAIGTVADIAPLIGENRRLVWLGLDQLNRRPRRGVQLLLEKAGFKKKVINARDIGFTIAPRLNASGRIAHAKISVELLIGQSEDDLSRIADQIQTLNEKRQQIGQQIYNESVKIVMEDKNRLEKNKVLVMSHSNWHSGVIGITASQLARKFSRPVVMISLSGGEGRGSARSVGSVDIFSILKNCSSNFKTFGGHKQAAGFSINPEQIKGFTEQCESIANTTISDSELAAILQIDATLPVELMTLEFAWELQDLAPFGHQNPEPLFYSNRLKAVDFKCVGDGTHLKATFTDEKGKVMIEGIGFGLAHKIELLYQPHIELAFHLGINSFKGVEVSQLQLVDIK
ncbi:MAG: single-stranded-DNA-specific exonuclease RecJ [Candidatus Margulisbacteria bacterium]|nr:single-stranded-DNA-specific exonuclease RecJ [Candidatus Margulisiibacteriota bacterium]